MALTVEEQQALLNKQIKDWTKEMRRLASLMAAAKGKQCAVILVSGTDPDYADVVPELILEDLLRVKPHGWPEGFEIDLLNPAN